MKKIITLAVTAFITVSGFAQFNHNNNDFDNDRKRDAIYRDDNRNNDRLYVYNNRERDREIVRINRDYDRRIQSVRHRWFMSHAKKERLIWSLEMDRKREIRMVYEKYNGRRDDNHHHGRH